ncbi:MAG: hypothetical protein C5B50_16985 [Verrucomicrobia bacterium]|nr:MAG: hypothetical protein C5B50_16985 [Verrucomicrobiota bacterium]
MEKCQNSGGAQCTTESRPSVLAGTAGSGKTESRPLWIGLLIFAAALRLWNFPARDEIRDMDEIGYATSGLVAWEGISPGWCFVPAGPQIWTGWTWAATRSAWELAHVPRGTPPLLKPLKAIDTALFKTDEDLGGLRRLMLSISLVIALAGVYGGYRVGAKYGRLPGGLLIGGLVACMPLFVENAGILKSSCDAWMFGILAVSSAATLSRMSRAWVPGVFLGLAIGSRIDMVVLAPLMLWAMWDNWGPSNLLKPALKAALAAAVTAFMTAPWAVTGFLTVLRGISLTRVVGYSYSSTESPRLRTLQQLAWEQGLGPFLLAIVAGLALFFYKAQRKSDLQATTAAPHAPPPQRERIDLLKHSVLAILAVFTTASLFIGQYQLMRYHGAPLIVLLVAGAVAVGKLLARLSQKAAVIVALILLALPLSQSFVLVLNRNAFYSPDASTEWIEKHVPAGTVVYLHANMAVRPILPTAAAADAIWATVANDQAWRTKLREGLQRFSLPDTELPRGLSENNLCMDRSVSRRWFILGGDHSKRPRYDVRPISLSKTFNLSIEQAIQEMSTNGGVLLWREWPQLDPLPPGMGQPAVAWLNSQGHGTRIFVSPGTPLVN